MPDAMGNGVGKLYFFGSDRLRYFVGNNQMSFHYLVGLIVLAQWRQGSNKWSESVPDTGVVGITYLVYRPHGIGARGPKPCHHALCE